MEMALAVLSTFGFIATIHMMVAAKLWPAWFLRMVDGPGAMSGERITVKGARYLYLGASLIGLGAAGYLFSKACLWWIPSWLGRQSEEGSWVPLVEVIASIVAFYAAFGLFSGLHKLAIQEVRAAPNKNPG